MHDRAINWGVCFGSQCKRSSSLSQTWVCCGFILFAPSDTFQTPGGICASPLWCCVRCERDFTWCKKGCWFGCACFSLCLYQSWSADRENIAASPALCCVCFGLRGVCLCLPHSNRSPILRVRRPKLLTLGLWSAFAHCVGTGGMGTPFSHWAHGQFYEFLSYLERNFISVLKKLASHSMVISTTLFLKYQRLDKNTVSLKLVVKFLNYWFVLVWHQICFETDLITIIFVYLKYLQNMQRLCTKLYLLIVNCLV